MISDTFNDKKILVWGYGREGRSTEKWLNTHASPACIDIFEGTPEEMASGKGDDYDIIIKRKNACWERILLQVIDLEGNALDETSDSYAPRKVIENGTLYIQSGNKRYSVLGVERKNEE